MAGWLTEGLPCSPFQAVAPGDGLKGDIKEAKQMCCLGK